MAAYSVPGFITFRGRPALQTNSITFKVETDNKDVNTLLLGRAGHSPGSKKVSLSIKNALPLAGPEIDWVGIALAQAEVELGFKIAGKTYLCAGDVRDADYDTSTEKANELSFNFSGRVVGIL